MNLLRYQIVVLAQFVLILYDLFANSFSELFSNVNVNLSVIYVVQDLCILLCILIFCLLLSSTFVFKQISRWNSSLDMPSSAGYQVLLAFQRTWSVLYYFFYKRTIYRLGDIRYYEDCEWIRKQIENSG
ncbi:unnamed protein product [Heterobilharzia americana]|nr:unnamed protein product [Heterobilharzia americana]